jgi:hypothetical protein
LPKPSSAVKNIWRQPGAKSALSCRTTFARGVNRGTSGDDVMTWPADHTGWRLQVQTNSRATGLGTNWEDVDGAMTNNVVLLLDYLSGSVFYRLVYP